MVDVVVTVVDEVDTVLAVLTEEVVVEVLVRPMSAGRIGSQPPVPMLYHATHTSSS